MYVCERAKEGAQGEGVSHGRAPSGARLAWRRREPRTGRPERAPRPSACPLGPRTSSIGLALSFLRELD